MARRRTSILQGRINQTSGVRQNMNGAGAGGRLVTRRAKTAGGATRTVAGRTQLGSRNQRYRDLRTSFGLSAG